MCSACAARGQPPHRRFCACAPPLECICMMAAPMKQQNSFEALEMLGFSSVPYIHIKKMTLMAQKALVKKGTQLFLHILMLL